MGEVRRELMLGDTPILFSRRAERTGESPISQMLAQALANPELISLAAGFVDYETLPVAELREVTALLLSDEAAARSALQYGTTQGLPSLRERLAAKGIDINEGTLYTLLRRLESQGLLKSSWKVEGSRPRRYYSISAKGKKVLAEVTREWNELGDVMKGLLSK